MPALTAPVTFGPDATGKKQPDGSFLERGGPIEPYWKEADRLGERLQSQPPKPARACGVV